MIILPSKKWLCLPQQDLILEPSQTEPVTATIMQKYALFLCEFRLFLCRTIVSNRSPLGGNVGAIVPVAGKAYSISIDLEPGVCLGSGPFGGVAKAFETGVGPAATPVVKTSSSGSLRAQV